MFAIINEDLPKVNECVKEVLKSLNDMNNKCERYVNLGEDYSPLTVTGYWVGNVARIDIKVKNR